MPGDESLPEGLTEVSGRRGADRRRREHDREARDQAEYDLHAQRFLPQVGTPSHVGLPRRVASYACAPGGLGKYRHGDSNPGFRRERAAS